MQTEKQESGSALIALAVDRCKLSPEIFNATA
jgi:hypothetical protein